MRWVKLIKLVKLVKWVKLVKLVSVHFFDIRTSKKGSIPAVFDTFHCQMCFAPQQRALFRHLNFQTSSEHVLMLPFWFGNVLRATRACTFSTSQFPNVVRDRQLLYTFYLDMCLAQQRHALFRHLNFQKWSDVGLFCTFWLGHVLRATTARSFFRQLNFQVLGSWGVCAFWPQRHAIFHLSSGQMAPHPPL